MSYRRLLVGLTLLSLVGFVYKLKQPQPIFGHGQIKVPAGVIVAREAPVQIDRVSAQAFQYQDAQLTPLASFEFDARLISVAWYSDQDSRYSPADLGIGWGKMSDSANIDALDWSHSARFLSYRWSTQPPIPAQEIIPLMANVHVIPANAAVLTKIGKLKYGQRIRGTGKLVEVAASGGYRWRSSMSRNDTGKGACEVMYLETLEVR
jgi:hypothetical protein